VTSMPQAAEQYLQNVYTVLALMETYCLTCTSRRRR
jgi:hypothetical protein